MQEPDNSYAAISFVHNKMAPQAGVGEDLFIGSLARSIFKKQHK
jgi:hypothetical protein